MIHLLLLSSALAGTLVVDAKVPVDIRSKGLPVAQLTWPGEIRLDVDGGEYPLELWVGGTPQGQMVNVADEGETRVIVGRSGITTEYTAPDPDAEKVSTPAQVRFRIVGRQPLVLQLAGKRYTVHSDEPLEIELEQGEHDIKVRSSDGTAIWATGLLNLDGAEEIVVQLAEGRSPEVSGDGARWEANSR